MVDSISNLELTSTVFGVEKVFTQSALALALLSRFGLLYFIVEELDSVLLEISRENNACNLHRKSYTVRERGRFQKLYEVQMKLSRVIISPGTVCNWFGGLINVDETF